MAAEVEQVGVGALGVLDEEDEGERVVRDDRNELGPSVVPLGEVKGSDVA